MHHGWNKYYSVNRNEYYAYDSNVLTGTFITWNEYYATVAYCFAPVGRSVCRLRVVCSISFDPLQYDSIMAILVFTKLGTVVAPVEKIIPIEFKVKVKLMAFFSRAVC